MKSHCYYHSPIGKLLLVGENEELAGLHFAMGVSVDNLEQGPNSSLFAKVSKQLDEYFEGKRHEFQLRLRLKGSPFQIAAWRALSDIPYGTTISYKEQADRIGSVPRAVGLANGQNPLAIILPCHRVIGANGSLTGYGGGLERKAALLSFEANVRDFGPAPMNALA